MSSAKNKPHKGLLKRVRISKTGFVKHKSANSKHLKSAKSPNRLRRLRKSRIASNAEMTQLELMLHRRVRGATQPRTALRRNPSPEERHAAEAAAKTAKASAPAPAKKVLTRRQAYKAGVRA